ncbi:uncharacterized protein [Chelonus insularis]|uniref:uncharacterized protein n=1 Tax=Chelonus insularis TaxID=460826 RepID=UPI00158930E8|nr:uncharacterized protein LOC118074448 [Chelonus insularis]
MNLIVIALLLPLAISAQRYQRLSNPNDEPFLPIFPVYPYSPKLIKRGTEKHFLSQLNPEAFTPKPNTRDSYSTSFNGNYQRDSTSATSAPNIYQPAYTSTNQAYNPSQAYATVPRINPPNYNANLYPYALYNSYPVTLIAQPYTTLYPNYQQVYYANSNSNLNYKQAYTNSKTNESSKNDLRNEKNLERPRNELAFLKDGFIDGTNYVSNSRDVEDSNLYKQSTFNQLQVKPDASELHLRSAQLPATAYHQLVGIEKQQNRQPNYALSPSGYKYQQLDSTMAAALSRLLTQQSVAQQGLNPPSPPSLSNQYEVSDVHQNMAPPAIQRDPSSVIAKTGLAYVMNQPINVSPRHIAKMPEAYQLLDPTGGLDRGQKVTQVTFEPSESIYIPPIKSVNDSARYHTDYNEFIQQANQPYGGTTSSSSETSQVQQPSQAYVYRYSGYNSTPGNQDQSTNYRIPLDTIGYTSDRNM